MKRTRTGLGLFALRSISKGSRIIEYVGPLVPNDEVDKSSGKYFFAVNKKWSVDGSARSNIARYINHSCQPNAEALVSNRHRIWIHALRNIKPGEEITYDYGKEYFEGIIEAIGCKCEKCRPQPSRAKARSQRAPAISSESSLRARARASQNVTAN